MAKTLSADKVFVSDLRGNNPDYPNGVRRGQLQQGCREWGRWRGFLDPTGVEQRITAVAPRAPAGQGMPIIARAVGVIALICKKIRPDQRADCGRRTCEVASLVLQQDVCFHGKSVIGQWQYHAGEAAWQGRGPVAQTD